MSALGYFVKIFVLSVLVTEGFTIAKWYMHTMCRRYLFDYGGELVLEESLLPPHQDSCFVTVVGNGSQHNKISFFFSSFHVGSDCQGNVTLIDGIADLYTRRVMGLEKSLCKYGHLDERSIYETRERYLGIMFHRRRDRWRTSSNVSLTLKFVSFQNEGEPCDPEDTGKMHSCSNGRCISNDVLCRDLNPCADFSDACEESGIQQTPAKVILSTSKYIIIGVGAFVGLLCLAQGCFVVRRCCCSRGTDSADEEKSHVELKSKKKLVPESSNCKEMDVLKDHSHTFTEGSPGENQSLLNTTPNVESDININDGDTPRHESDTVRTASDHETRYQSVPGGYQSVSGKDISEEINQKIRNRANDLETEANTNLKRLNS